MIQNSEHRDSELKESVLACNAVSNPLSMGFKPTLLSTEGGPGPVFLGSCHGTARRMISRSMGLTPLSHGAHPYAGAGAFPKDWGVNNLNLSCRFGPSSCLFLYSCKPQRTTRTGYGSWSKQRTRSTSLRPLCPQQRNRSRQRRMAQWRTHR